jgi:predicted  nucleic acid-binding Zn-ribbon protein
VTEPSTDAETDYEKGVAKLERELAFARRNGGLAVKQMHALLAKELRTAERELGQARKRADKLKERLERAKAETATARRRAEVAERELAAVKASTTWKAGRAVVAVPARIRRLGRR